MTTNPMISAASSAGLQLVTEPPATTSDAVMEAVETIMFNAVNTDVTTLRDASRHILDAGGKRIRPRLVLLGYEAFGGKDISKVAPVAAAVELVHTASVVHDDINDHGLIRRGRPSINSIWGRTFALLTGDFLFTKVYELMAPYKDLNIILAEATVALVEGETLQASAVKENTFTREAYYDIIARKTAALFRAGAKLGAKLANATERQVEAIGTFGFNIGLAFQIIDDILDLIGDEAQLGKTAGIDQAQGKGLASIQGENGYSDPMIALRAKMSNEDTIREGRLHAEALVQVAIAELDVLPSSPARDALIGLAESVTNRMN